MSEVVTLTTGETATIYGTIAAAKTYIATKYGPQYDAWRALNANDDDRKRTLASATALIDQQAWLTAYNTLGLRDVVAAFPTASYELAVMVLADPSIVTLADQGSNIQSVAASGASVSYFNPTTKFAAPLPPILMRLLGNYLASLTNAGPVSPSGLSGSSVNPMSECTDYVRKAPF